jgi:hypothetical protein
LAERHRTDLGRSPVRERVEYRRYGSVVCGEIRVAALIADPVGHTL